MRESKRECPKCVQWILRPYLTLASWPNSLPKCVRPKLPIRRFTLVIALLSTIVTRPRQFVLLAPNDSNVLAFRNVAVDPYRHDELLAEAQRLRGKAYLDMGALDASQLSEDGRHIHAVDDQSWHLRTLDGDGHVMACLRYLVHPRSVPFSELTIAHSALAQSTKWGQRLRRAVEEELRQARGRG